ncbi:MAG: sulfite oxidase-like oxidoreductase [Rhodospirillales bacterium]
MPGGNGDDRFKDLFAGRSGSVLGDMKAQADKDASRDTPPPDSKLTQTKKQWARDARQPQTRRRDGGGRMPPGQHLSQDWPVLDLGHRPLVPTDQWEMKVLGAVDRPLTLSWQQFLDLPQIDLTTDIHCVTSWSTYDNRWRGVAVRTLANAAGLKDTAGFAVLHSHDGYTTNLPLDHFLADTSLIVHSWNGAPLTRDHGGPARAVVPSLYFWKSAKWLRQITFLEKDAPGYWETRGYHNLGDPWKQQRYG